jgi:hypothetical protein
MKVQVLWRKIEKDGSESFEQKDFISGQQVFYIWINRCRMLRNSMAAREE